MTDIVLDAVPAANNGTVIVLLGEAGSVKLRFDPTTKQQTTFSFCGANAARIQESIKRGLKASGGVAAATRTRDTIIHDAQETYLRTLQDLGL